MEDLTGMRLGQYQVLAPLGEGGMAAVYRAYQASVDREVALKILPRHFASDPEFTGRFEQEAKLIARLQHVHILPVYDFGEAEGYTYIVMPYIETGTLAEKMSGAPMPLEQVRSVVIQVAEALSYAHARGLVHRDVKPSNILIDHAGNCLLTDFGIAKIVGGSTKFTQTGAIIGTPAYMSPEQIRGEALDGRSDQYSLGIVLYEMATGRPPFRAETPPAIFVKHLHDPLPPPTTINPDLPPDLEHVILKSLAKDPADRYGSLRDMILALDRAIPRRPEIPVPPQADLAPTLAAETRVGEQPLKAPSVEAEPVPEPKPESVSRPTPAPPQARAPRAPRRIPTWAWFGGGALGLAAVAALGIALLGGGGLQAPQPTSRPPTAEPAPTAVPAQVSLAGSTVHILTAAGDEQMRRFESNFAGFEAETGIEVVVESAPNFESLAVSRLESGDPYDILIFPQPGLMADMARGGHLVDIGQFLVASQLRDAYDPSWIDQGRVDGRVYGIWHGADVKSLVWYPKPAWEAAEYPIPQSWDELIELSDRMVAEGRTPWCIGIEAGGATGWPATDWIEDILLRTASPEIYDAWVRGELPFESPEVIGAFERLAEIWFNPNYVLGGRESILSTPFGEALLPMFDDPPGCWMHRQASFIPNFFPEGTEVGVDAGYFYFPPIDPAYGRPVLSSGNLASLAKDTPAGREVIRFMITPASVEAEVRAGDLIAPMHGVPLDWYPTEAQRGYAEILNSADVVRFDASDLMPGTVGAGSFWSGMVNFIRGEDLQAVLASIDASWPGRAVAGRCGDPLGCVEIPPGEPVHIAYLLTLSGPTEYLGRDTLGGIELALEDRDGLLLGHPLLLSGEDSGCSAETGPAAAGRLVADASILGVIGTNCSTAMIPSLGLLSGAGFTVISPSNTAPSLTLEGENWQPGYFRTSYTDLLQGKLAASFVREVLRVDRAATIHDGTPYSVQLQQVFTQSFEELGGQIVFQGGVDPAETDLRQVLAGAVGAEPQLLYFPLFEPQGSLLVQQSREIAGLADVVLMGADGLFSDGFPEAAGTRAEGMYLSAPHVAGPQYEAMLSRWEARFGGSPPSGFHAFAYDAANLLLEAIEHAANQTPDGTLIVGRQTLREVVQSTRGLAGLTGQLDCGDKDYGALGISHGDCATGQALAVYVIGAAEIDQGRWPPDVVWRPEP